MALYHFRGGIISRRTGRSVVAAAAYRAGEKLYDSRRDELHDYSKKPGVVAKAIYAPLHSPSWVTSRQLLWNAVEHKSNRSDARLARELELALPVELNLEQQKELLRDYVNEVFVSRGMVADVCIHHDNKENPHAHVLLTTREINSGGFGRVITDWNKLELFLDWRRQWANYTNLALQKAGHDVRIDHRSYAEQGIDLIPTVHVGSPRNHDGDRRDLIKERRAKNEAIKRANGQAIDLDPAAALRAITYQRATFTKRDVARWLQSYTVDHVQFAACLDRIMTCDELVPLGTDARGVTRYTSKEMQQAEAAMFEAAQKLSEHLGHHVDEQHFGQARKLDNLELTDGQEKALRYVVMDTCDIACVEGFAGTGKSRMLGIARAAWEAAGYKVHGAALAGRAAEELEESSGIPSRSIASWEYGWRSSSRHDLDKNSIFVLDEAGMVGTRQMMRVLSYAEAAGAKVVLVGDAEQLQAIEAGAPFRGIAGRVGQVQLTDIVRLKEEWQKNAVLSMAQGWTNDGLRKFLDRGFIHRHETNDVAMRHIIDAWSEHRLENPDHTQLMLAYRRVDVRELNMRARQIRQDAGELGQDHRFATNDGDRDFAVGDRIYFLQRDRQLGVNNGTLATISMIDGNVVVAETDDERYVVWDATEYTHWDHGYAATVHKSQGATVHRTHVLADSYFDRHTTYVAMSRHKAQVDLHWSKEMLRDYSKFFGTLSRPRPKDLAHDYTQAHQLRKPDEPVVAPSVRLGLVQRDPVIEESIAGGRGLVAQVDTPAPASADPYVPVASIVFPEEPTAHAATSHGSTSGGRAVETSAPVQQERKVQTAKPVEVETASTPQPQRGSKPELPSYFWDLIAGAEDAPAAKEASHENLSRHQDIAQLELADAVLLLPDVSKAVRQRDASSEELRLAEEDLASLNENWAVAKRRNPLRTLVARVSGDQRLKDFMKHREAAKQRLTDAEELETSAQEKLDQLLRDPATSKRARRMIKRSQQVAQKAQQKRGKKSIARTQSIPFDPFDG